MMNPAEMINNILNQQILSQGMAMHGQLPQLLQNLPGFAAPRGVPGVSQVPGQPGAVPTTSDPQRAQIMHLQAQQALQQMQNQQQHQLQQLQYQQHMRNVLNPNQNLQPNPQTTNTAPVTRSSSPLASAEHPPNVAIPAVQASNGTAQPHAAPLLGGPGIPQTGVQTTTGIGPDGQRFNITVQHSVIGFRPAGAPGQPHPQTMPNVNLGQPGQVPNVNLPFFAAPNGQQPNLPPMFIPGQHFQGHMNVPFPGTSPGGVSPVRTPSQGSTTGEDRHRRIADAMVLLSALLLNASRSIQMLGGRIASSQAQAQVRPGIVRESISYLQAVEDAEAQLRAFDYQFAQAAALWPDVLTNPQYIQTQERRRGAGAALARVFEIVRSDVMAGGNQPTIPMTRPSNVTATSPAQSAHSSDTVTPPSTTVPPTSNEQQIYILNDQNGSPYALLVGPNGQHASRPLPWNILQPMISGQLPPLAIARAVFNSSNNAYAQTINSVRGHDVRRFGFNSLADLRRASDLRTVRTQHVGRNQHGPEAQQVGDAAGDAPAGDAAQAVQAREPDEMRDMLAPIIRNLWLAIRIAGFTYLLFGGGRALWRPLMLGIGLTIIWAAQAGMFGDRFDGFRRYLDRLVGAEPEQRQDAAAPANAGDNQAGQNGQLNDAQAAPIGQVDGAHGGQIAPAPIRTPQELARRLVNQQQAEEATWLMQQVRYVERMFGLFFASLWPGIGEQAVRLQEERERRAREAANRELEELAARAAALLEAAQAEETSTGAKDTTEQQEDPATPTQLSSLGGATSASSEASASGVDPPASEESSLSRVNKGKERATGQVPDTL
jgi:hypothetical protein